ncbi:MAG: NAD-dependent epimerase/dehydratase family protein [Candidatus Woesearchaeota archaeon]|nr:NAD-dependent epimerase/dehydratase family protein [Candidatus Woesearchaeota archaeon]
MRRLAIVGGLGFLGKYLQKILKREYKGYEIFVLDIQKEPGDKMQKDFKYFQCDIADYAQLEKIVKGCSVLFHLAGMVSYHRKDLPDMEKVNILGTRNVCEACKKHKIKLVYASSTSAVGIGLEGISDEGIYPSKVHGTINGYSRTKLEAELIVQRYSDSVDVIIADLAAIIGDNIYFEKAVRAHRSRVCFLFDTYNTIVDVRDAAEAMVYLEKHGIPGERYIVAADISKTSGFQECLMRLLHVSSFKVTLKKQQIAFLKKTVRFLETFLGDSVLPVSSDFLMTADQDKMFSNQKMIRLGWKPKHSLNETLSHFVGKYGIER